MARGTDSGCLLGNVFCGTHLGSSLCSQEQPTDPGRRHRHLAPDLHPRPMLFVLSNGRVPKEEGRLFHQLSGTRCYEFGRGVTRFDIVPNQFQVQQKVQRIH